MDEEKEITATEKARNEPEEKKPFAGQADARGITAATLDQFKVVDRRYKITDEGNELTPAQEDQKEEAQPEDFFAEALGALRKERDSYYDQLLRKQAEFENYRKRVEREKADTRFAAKQEVLRELLNVLDACERGLQSMELHERSLDSYREGYELLQRQIKSLLAKFGVEEIEAVGRQFDPKIHEAILHEASDTHREGEVIEEIKKGYRLHDRLLRPAQVKVARTET